MIELDEWVYFVGEGISRSAAVRQKLAQSSSEYARLDRFLKAIEFYAVEMSDLVAVQNEEVKNTTVDQGDASNKSEGKVQGAVEVIPADVLQQGSDDGKSFEDWGDDDDTDVQTRL